ncbi:NAD(P)/FAD-dependent oxidoreductase [Pedobacter sp. CFBP9032]|uniref:NAD(P)/FAD-dependent oxidoreductase n=1 Tax=Pedobacter sp. CFBP9032 TaxID=3096539 RepID=UPI002A6A57C8|nr:NAD(P)/FAD-dependent oxidoreductase [Pedobacter sp. CFBP9032]MDY0903556.1 NAD(P)/FAD-dependent oxidoreductase [Pedobacter sp. CFBP9032]
MDFDVIIIGGSYAGLSAALTLGRATRKVLIVDSGKPCNRQTPHSHNFLTHDGEKPADISAKAKAEVLAYPNVKFTDGNVDQARKIMDGFEVVLETKETFSSRKILLSTGLKDTLPAIKGFAECWGITVIHCPYCHGYEVKNEKVGLMMNGDHAFEMAKMISLWNSDLTLYTNGESQLTAAQMEKLTAKSIKIIEDEIIEIEHHHGILENVVLSKGDKIALKALYARSEVSQHQAFYTQLGFELTEFNTIKINEQQETTAKGVYAAGDCTTLMRSLSVTNASGAMAGVMINREMLAEDF